VQKLDIDILQTVDKQVGATMDSQPTGLPELHSAATTMPLHGGVESATPSLRPKHPAASSSFVASAIMRIDCSDTDELAELLGDWTCEWTHLHPGAFSATMAVVPLGSVLICHGQNNKPLAEHSAPPEGCISIGRPGRGSDPVKCLGHILEEGQIFVTGPGGETESVGLGVRKLRALSIRCNLLEQQTDWLTHATALNSIRSVQVHTPGETWVAAYLDAMDWIVDAVERYPEATARPEVRGSMVDTLLARVNMLGAAQAPIHRDRQMRAHRRLGVERARDYIARNLTDPIRLSDLSRHALTQARSLEYGFQEVLGVSPMAYVRATRLQRARRLLRTTAVRTRSISEMALDCGFWHLSQFAIDYKLLFGESPSVTFRRTAAQLPRSERRRQPSNELRTGRGKAGASPVRAAVMA
jgi:AraC family transcriptional regulator, ethanolamine operon transcriptional activator